MSIYGELVLMPEHRTQFAVKDKWEHMVKVNMPNMEYPNQHDDIDVIVQDIVKLPFKLDTKSTKNHQCR